MDNLDQPEQAVGRLDFVKTVPSCICDISPTRLKATMGAREDLGLVAVHESADGAHGHISGAPWLRRGILGAGY